MCFCKLKNNNNLFVLGNLIMQLCIHGTQLDRKELAISCFGKSHSLWNCKRMKNQRLRYLEEPVGLGRHGSISPSNSKFPLIKIKFSKDMVGNDCCFSLFLVVFHHILMKHWRLLVLFLSKFVLFLFRMGFCLKNKFVMF